MIEHFRLCASAFRIEGSVDVTVYAALPDKCHDGQITRICLEDPDNMQISIRFTRRDEDCEKTVWTWGTRVVISDIRHKRLEAIGEFEGKEFRLGTSILDSRPQREACPFIVIGRSPGGHQPYNCRAVLDGTPIPQGYSQLFGPGSKEECDNWRKDNCLST